MAAIDVTKTDVFKLQTYLNKYVKISLCGQESELSGIVYTIDPVSEK